MPITLNANGCLMRIHYIAAGLPHVMNFNLDPTSPPAVGDDPTIIAWSGAGSNVPYSDVRDEVVNQLKGFWLPADTITIAELFRRDTGDLLVPIRTDTLTVAGTHTGGSAQRAEAQLTLSFRDIGFKKMRQTLFGLTDGGLAHSTVLPGGQISTYVGKMLSVTAFDIGNYVRSRAGKPAGAFIAWTVQSNNKSERRILGQE